MSFHHRSLLPACLPAPLTVSSLPCLWGVYVCMYVCVSQVVKREQLFVSELFKLQPDELDEDHQRLEVVRTTTPPTKPD